MKSGYRIVGRHSAVKICHWTKNVLRGGKHCYKNWYGINSHRCLQMTPSIQYCNMMCIFCWRFHTINRVSSYGGEWDSPEDIFDELIKEQRQLLSGFKGNPLVDQKLFREALSPKHMAISLDGEPTLYPYLGELIKLAHQRGMTTFLVTNGTNPSKLEDLINEGAEPTNLYISLYGPDYETHVKLCRPIVKDSWVKLNESLKLMPNFTRSRKVIRLTLIKGYNMGEVEKYGEHIKKAKPDYVECKAYMHVGESQKRLPREAMPSMKDIIEFSEELCKILRYKIVSHDTASRVSLLADESSPYYYKDIERIMKTDSS
ncbi:MAG: 4-demethylwyosine synthase TYW1 [Nitrososphaeria archaeon]|nr:4-demethylwyosine synthase TYW1 [Nitrososphaeria archaeon]